MSVRPDLLAMRPPWLRAVGVKLDLSDEVICTAAVYFHRFYAVHPRDGFDTQVMAMACLFLSAKVGEQQRKARDLINVWYSVGQSSRAASPMAITPQFWERKDRLVEYESYLLRALAFDVEVELPHHHLLSYARSLHCPAHVTQAAWGLVNDCFETTLVSDAKPHVVACAAIGLAASLAKVQLQLQRQAQPAQIVTPGAGADHGQQWFQVLGGATSSEIECVTERLTQLYAALEAHSQ